MAPIALQSSAFGGRILRADAEIAELALRHFDGQRQCSVRRQRVGFLDGDAGKDAELAKAVGGLAQSFRGVGLAAVQARIATDEIRIDRPVALDGHIPQRGDGAGVGDHRQIHSIVGVIGHCLALGQLCKGVTLRLQILDDLVAGPNDGKRACVSARNQTVVGRGASSHIAFQANGAEFEEGALRHINDDGNRTGGVEGRNRRDGIDILAGNGDIDEAAIARILIECGNQPVAIVLGADQQTQIARRRLVRLRHQKRTVFQAVAQLAVSTRRVEGHGKFDGIENFILLILVGSPQLDPKDLQRESLTHETRRTGNGCRHRQCSACPPVRNTLPLVSPLVWHTLLYG